METASPSGREGQTNLVDLRVLPPSVLKGLLVNCHERVV